MALFTDGGSAAAEVPHEEGFDPSLCESVPPCATADQSRDVCRTSRPFSDTLWTHRLVSLAPGALTVSVPPCDRPYCPIRTVADSNCGLDSARKFAPLIVGYNPNNEKTLQADIVPRSSLPVMPSGPVVNNNNTTRTTVAVLAGAPAHRYMY